MHLNPHTDKGKHEETVYKFKQRNRTIPIQLHQDQERTSNKIDT